MTISRQEVNQMASFMRALNTDSSLMEDSHVPVARPAIQGASGASVTSIKEMKDILDRFHAVAGSTVATMSEEATTDRSLREALMTERTAIGSRVGEWEIQVREGGKRKFYDVVQANGQTCIAADLLLYEAAHGLVRILNNGGKINCREAIGLLRSEQDFAGALNDAVLYKHYMVKHPRDKRIGVFEAKYSAAKQRAITARDKVVSFYELY